MRKFLFLVLFLSLFKIEGITKEDESRLIRKLYLDTIGILPTIEEIEWYVVYNDNGYDLAVKYVLNHPKMNYMIIPKNELILLFNSKQYKTLSKCYLTQEELIHNIYYVSGCEKTQDLNYVKLKIVQDALRFDTQLDILDYMANLFMCRTTTVDEANKLLKIYRENEILEDQERWILVLEELLKMEDVITK